MKSADNITARGNLLTARAYIKRLADTHYLLGDGQDSHVNRAQRKGAFYGLPPKDMGAPKMAPKTHDRRSRR